MNIKLSLGFLTCGILATQNSNADTYVRWDNGVSADGGFAYKTRLALGHRWQDSGTQIGFFFGMGSESMPVQFASDYKKTASLQNSPSFGLEFNQILGAGIGIGARLGFIENNFLVGNTGKGPQPSGTYSEVLVNYLYTLNEFFVVPELGMNLLEGEQNINRVSATVGLGYSF